jgi:DNA-directed RNA polymerase specialized sigma24 family protein
MPIDPSTLQFARTLVRIKARQITRPPARAGDRDDIEQTLLLEVLLRWPGYDPARGSKEAFVEQIVRGKVCTLLRGRRRSPRVASLERESLQIPDRNDPIREASLRLDVQVVVDQLRPRLREACDHLRRESQSDTARCMGVNRPSLLRALAKTREMFSAAGLGLYL